MRSHRVELADIFHPRFVVQLVIGALLGVAWVVFGLGVVIALGQVLS